MLRQGPGAPHVARVRLSPNARQHLNDIYDYISQDSPNAADALLDRIFDKLGLAAERPSIGVPRADIRSDARALVVGSYLALYIPDADGILVIAVVHGMMSPQNWFD